MAQRTRKAQRQRVAAVDSNTVEVGFARELSQGRDRLSKRWIPEERADGCNCNAANRGESMLAHSFTPNH